MRELLDYFAMLSRSAIFGSPRDVLGELDIDGETILYIRFKFEDEWYQVTKLDAEKKAATR